MSAQSLRPQTERALCRTSTRRIQRDKRLQQKRHAVFRHIQIALVDLRGPRHRIQIFHLRTIRIVYYFSVQPVADAENLIQRLAVRILDDRIVEFAAANKIQHRAFVQRAVGIRRYRRPHKRNPHRRIGRLDRFGQSLIALPAHCRREENKELILLANFDRFFRRDVVRWRIEQSRALQQTGGIRQPYRVPVGFNLARGRPARSGAAIKTLERGWVQK